MPGPCWHCIAFEGLDSSGSHALCTRPLHPRLCADPARGCVSWERAPGADDEAGPPPGFQGSAGAGWRDMVKNPDQWTSRR